jgi:hypothetical protein
MDNSIVVKKNDNGICSFIECLFYDLGVPANEQIILWKMFKGTSGCKDLLYYLLKIKEMMLK